MWRESKFKEDSRFKSSRPNPKNDIMSNVEIQIHVKEVKYYQVKITLIVLFYHWRFLNYPSYKRKKEWGFFFFFLMRKEE